MGRQRKLAQALDHLFSGSANKGSTIEQGHGEEDTVISTRVQITPPPIEGGNDVETEIRQRPEKNQRNDAIGVFSAPQPVARVASEDEQGVAPMPKGQSQPDTIPGLSAEQEEQHVIFTLGDGYYGLPVEAVERQLSRCSPLLEYPKHRHISEG